VKEEDHVESIQNNNRKWGKEKRSCSFKINNCFISIITAAAVVVVVFVVFYNR